MDEAIFQKLDIFFKQYKHQIYKKGEILIRADEDPLGVFYLKKGTVKEYAISKNGTELVVNIFKAPSFFPMSWAINQTPNNYYFEALEELEIWRAPRDETVKFIKSDPAILFDLMSRVFKGLDGILMRLVRIMSGDAHSRLIIELLITAKRFGKQNSNTTELSISEKDLANQSGLARETVSREISKLKEKGLVSLKDGKLHISDLLQLEEELT